ncbi:hypothetical protein C8R45DRAFT_493631 [Mycena sanguinolenta]|nr:hypothetical protein C8R45DRAFT_493631 [Mycena sanguinolenta]
MRHTRSLRDMNLAIIFSPLQVFNIRAPLIFIPFFLSALSDVIFAFGRIGKFRTVEELPDPYLIEPERKNADASFVWETAGRLEVKFVVGRRKGKGGSGKGGISPIRASRSSTLFISNMRTAGRRMQTHLL